MTPETKATALEALAGWHDALRLDEASWWRFMPGERRYRPERDMSERALQRRRIARELRRVRRAMRELRDCE